MPLGLKAIAFVAAAATVIGSAMPAVSAKTLVRRKKLRGGVTYSVYRERRPANRIRVLKVDLAKRSKMRVSLGTRRLPGAERTSSMARRSKAIAGINGDYALPSGRPVMTFARGGRLVQTPQRWGRNFAVDGAEENTYIGHPNVRVEVAASGGRPRRVGRVNAGRPGERQLALFTRAGGALERPPKRACSARLRPSEDVKLRSTEDGITATYFVGRVRCAKERMRRKDGIVLAARRQGSKAPFVSGLKFGQSMSLTWTLGWPRVRATLGGNPTLVEKGRIPSRNVDGTGAFFARNPRTGVGTTRGGKVLLVTVDGRQPGYSRGMTLRQFARLFRSLGARWALNLDGGGSTTMVVEGRVVNRPSDGPERAVSSSLLVVPGGSGGSGGSAGAVEEAPPGAWRGAETDPGSTGGLSSALAARGRRLPPALEQVARAFDAGR